MSARQAVYRNSEVKNRVYDRASSSTLEAGKLTQSIVKNSKSKDIIHQTTKHFVNLESSLVNINQNLITMDKCINRIDKQSDDALQILKHIEMMNAKLHKIKDV